MNRTVRKLLNRSLLLGVLSFAAALPVSAQTKFDHAEYLKSAQPGEKKKGETVQGSVSFEAENKVIRFLSKDGAPEFTIAAGSVKGLHYERTSRPRYAEGLLIAWPLLFTKSKKHFLTIQYADAAGTGQFAIIHMDKNNYQQILAAAEAQTGVKVDRSEEK